MKVFKKILAVLCSATLIVSASVTAFAADPETTVGTGNILAYHYDSVVVPTSFKVALNPNQYTVTIRDSGTTTTTDQIVTFNYGIANLSTGNKVVNVSLGVIGTTGDGTPITFVDTIAEAQAYDAESNETGAKAGELKMYLELVAASALPTTSADAAFAVEAKTGDVNVTNVDASSMTDVTMTAADDGAIVFKPATGKYALAETAFSLGKATYDVQDGQTVDFTTTQTALASLMEITAIGATGVTGFTIAGAMNPDADWTKADVKALSFAPVYAVTDATGSEVAAGGFQQVKTASEVAAGAAGTFLTTHGDVVALLGDLTAVTGTEAEMGKIDAAIAAFEALDETEDAAVITALADNDPSVTADTLGALKDASAAKATGDANASAAAAFKSTYSEVLALTVDTVEGTAEELEAINAAGSAFGALDDAVKTILAEDGIDAEFFTDLAAASEAAAVTIYALSMNDSGNLTYKFESNKPTGAFSAVTVNGQDKTAKIGSNITYTESTGKFVVTSTMVTGMSLTEGATTIVATIGGEEYTFEY